MLLNAPRFAETLAQSGLAALVATTPQNVEYAAGYHTERFHNFVALQTYMVMPPNVNEFVMVVPTTELLHFGSKPNQIAKIKRYGSFFVMADRANNLSPNESRLLELMQFTPIYPSPVEGLAVALEEAGLAHERIGLDENNMPWPILEALRQRLPRAHFEPAAQLLRTIRLVKSDAEIELIRKACQINEKALQTAIAAAGVGIGEDEPYRAFRMEFTSQGGVPRAMGHQLWPGQQLLLLARNQDARAG